MVAVFFTFALSGPLPPKEMGVILGVAVLLDALLVRLLLVPSCCGCSDSRLVAPHPAAPHPPRDPTNPARAASLARAASALR